MESLVDPYYLRVFVGYDAAGKLSQVSRPFAGSHRAAERFLPAHAAGLARHAYAANIALLVGYRAARRTR